MNRRLISFKKIFLFALAGALVFLSLLPSLGWVWHSVLPEHQHWLANGAHVTASVNRAAAQAECADCSAEGITLTHLPSFSVAGAVVALAPALTSFISAPNKIFTHVPVKVLKPISPQLVQFDPPPETR